MLGESTGRERIDDEAVDLSGEIRGTPVARTEKRLGPSDSDRWVSVARCIDWPIWQEKNAAAANTWPQPAEWPAEHYNAGRASFLPRGGPRRFSVRAIRVISPSQDQHLTNCNLILEPNENPRPPTPSLPRLPPHPLPSALLLPPFSCSEELGNQASSMKKLAYSFCRPPSAPRLLIELVFWRESEPFGNRAGAVRFSSLFLEPAVQ